MSSLNVDVRVWNTGLRAQIMPTKSTVYLMKLNPASSDVLSALKLKLNAASLPAGLCKLSLHLRPSVAEARQKMRANMPMKPIANASATKNCGTVSFSNQSKKNRACGSVTGCRHSVLQ